MEGTIAKLAEWLELPDLPAPWVVRWVGVESRRTREIEEPEWLAKRMLDPWRREGRSVCPRSGSETDEHVSNLQRRRLRWEDSPVRDVSPLAESPVSLLGVTLNDTPVSVATTSLQSPFSPSPPHRCPGGRGLVHQCAKCRVRLGK